MLLVMNPRHPQPRKISKAIEMLKQGKAIAYPTEYGYGIGCDLRQIKTAETLLQLLPTPIDPPFCLLCRDFKQISTYAFINDQAYRTAKRICPGPFTLLFKASKQISKRLRGKRKTIGVRIPGHPIAKKLLEELDSPILHLDAVDTHQEPMDDPFEIESVWGKHLASVLDCDLLTSHSTTFVDMSEDEPHILHLGIGDPNEII